MNAQPEQQPTEGVETPSAETEAPEASQDTTQTTEPQPAEGTAPAEGEQTQTQQQ